MSGSAPWPSRSRLPEVLEQMIIHHEGVIEMAQDEVGDGRNAEVIGLAESIIASQIAEIATMEDILATL